MYHGVERETSRATALSSPFRVFGLFQKGLICDDSILGIVEVERICSKIAIMDVLFPPVAPQSADQLSSKVSMESFELMRVLGQGGRKALILKELLRQ